MTTPALLQSLANILVRLEIHADRIKVIGPTGVVTPAMRQDLRDRRNEILTLLNGQSAPAPPTASSKSESTQAEVLIEDGRRVRWLTKDERGCRKCKRCGGPIIWAQVVEDTDPKAKRNAWIRLDPDLMPHGCGGPRAGRFIDPESKPTDGATAHDDK